MCNLKTTWFKHEEAYRTAILCTGPLPKVPLVPSKITIIGSSQRGFSKGGFSNNDIIITHKLLNPPLLTPPL